MAMAAATMAAAAIGAGQPPSQPRTKAAVESASGHYASRGHGGVAPRPFWPLVDSVEGFACASFPRQRQCDKPPCSLFSARLPVRLIGDPNFERAKLDRVQRYNDRSRAETRACTS